MNLLAQNGNDLFALIVLGILTTLTFLLLAMVYFPVRRRQVGGTYAALCTVVQLAVTIDLAITIGWVIVTDGPAAVIGWHLSGVFTLFTVWVVADYGRYRASRPSPDEVLVEFGSGLPGTWRIGGLKNLGWMTTVFMFSIFPRVMRMLQKGRAEVLLPIGAVVAYGLTRAVLDGHTKWTCTEFGLSVWGRAPLSWSEIRSYRWERSFTESNRTLVMETEFGDEISCAVAGSRISNLQEVLKKYLGAPTEADLPITAESTELVEPSVEDAASPAWATDGRTTFIRYELTRESVARAHRMGATQRGCRSIFVWLLMVVGIGSVAGTLFALKTHPLVILAVALFLLLAGFVLMFVVWPIVLAGWSNTMRDAMLSTFPNTDRPEHVVLATNEGLVFPVGNRTPPAIKWQNIDRAILVDDYLMIAARISGIGAAVGLLAVSPREVLEGDLDRFIMEVDSRVPVERE